MDCVTEDCAGISVSATGMSVGKIKAQLEDGCAALAQLEGRVAAKGSGRGPPRATLCRAAHFLAGPVAFLDAPLFGRCRAVLLRQLTERACRL